MTASVGDRGFPVVDVDSHVWEPEVIWSDYVAETDRDVARQAFSRRGDEITVGGEPAKPLFRSKINRHAVWRPGMTVDDIGALDPDAEHAENPGAWDAAARLADLDALGIEQQIVLPELFGEYFRAVSDARASVALARAYNDWANDFAGAGDGRLHPVAVVPMADVDAAVAELDRVAARGMKSVLLRPMFYAIPDEKGRLDGAWVIQTSGQGGENPVGVYVDHPGFHPVWRRVEELGLVACVHPYLGIANQEATSEGSFVERVAEKLGIGHSVTEPVAYLQDNALFVVIAAFHGLLEDFPNLKLALLHSGAAMVPLSLEKAETYLWLSPQSVLGADKPVCLEPEEVFERSRVVVGFDGWESSAVRLLGFFADKGSWGSRYPHHDASTPADALALCERYEVPEAIVARLLGGNAADLFGISVPAAV